MVQKEDDLIRDDKQLYSIIPESYIKGQERVIKLSRVSELTTSQSETGRKCEAMHNASRGFK